MRLQTYDDDTTMMAPRTRMMTYCDGRRGIGNQHGGGGGDNGSTVDAVVGGGGRRPWRIGDGGRQVREAQAMAAAAGWPASLLTVHQ